MILLNFSHPLIPDQLQTIVTLAGGVDISVHDIPTHIDNQAPLLSQVVALVDAVPLSPVTWQSTPIAINPPGYAPVVAVLVTELHGRMGHFPTLVRMRPVLGATPTRYEVVELLNLQNIREHARARR